MKQFLCIDCAEINVDKIQNVLCGLVEHCREIFVPLLNFGTSIAQAKKAQRKWLVDSFLGFTMKRIELIFIVTVQFERCLPIAQHLSNM